MRLGAIIEQMRRNRKFQFDAVAKELKITTRQYRNVEAADVGIDPIILASVVKLFKIPAADAEYLAMMNNRPNGLKAPHTEILRSWIALYKAGKIVDTKVLEQAQREVIQAIDTNVTAELMEICAFHD